MRLWLMYSAIFFSVQVHAASVDCEGDCTNPDYESNVMPNRRPAVVLQEEIESIARKGKLTRGPAVVAGEEEATEDISPVCKNNLFIQNIIKTLKSVLNEDDCYEIKKTEPVSILHFIRFAYGVLFC